MNLNNKQKSTIWKHLCPNCGWINIQDSKRPTDKCHRCGHEREEPKK